MKREERIANILMYIDSSKDPCSITEITKKLKITQSSVSRVLSSLETLHWVSRSGNGYIIGNQLLRLSISITSKLDIRRVCQPFLNDLQRATNETAALYLRVGLNEICVDQIESSYSIRHVVQYALEHPLWSGSSGKATLAYMNRDEIEEVFKNLIKSETKAYPTGRPLYINRIRKELEMIKKRGYSISTGERSMQASSVSSPIFENNRVRGAIVITGPLSRFNIKKAQKFSPIVVQAARKISELLGSTL